MVYRVRDIDLRARRIGEPKTTRTETERTIDHTRVATDSNSATRSFGASIDLLRPHANDQCRSSMTLDAILEVRRSPNVHEQT